MQRILLTVVSTLSYKKYASFIFMTYFAVSDKLQKRQNQKLPPHLISTVKFECSKFCTTFHLC